MDAKGIHRVRSKLAGGRARYRYYAWRGGPCFWTCDNAPVREPVPTAFKAAYEQAILSRPKGSTETGTLRALIRLYESDAAFRRRKPITQRDYRRSMTVIEKTFGTARLGAFADRRMIRRVMEWHQGFAATPRQADMHLGMLVRLLNYAVASGDLASHVIHNIPRLHDADRSAIVWEAHEIERIISAAGPPLSFALRIAAYSGARRTDLVFMPVSADEGDRLFFQTSKSNRRTDVLFPVTPELRSALDDMAAYRKAAAERTGAECATILCNSRGLPWTPDGFSTSFNKARAAANIDKHLHDLRGTAVVNYIGHGYDDRALAEMFGWATKDIARIRKRYAGRVQVVSASIERGKRRRP
ncbi:tyrosine-type recombinase/integrase [Breoghania corrubedonensis]|nr:tyrosine-type recombinase/integrase [Breoghania corrubedonensis]